MSDILLRPSRRNPKMGNSVTIRADQARVSLPTARLYGSSELHAFQPRFPLLTLDSSAEDFCLWAPREFLSAAFIYIVY